MKSSGSAVTGKNTSEYFVKAYIPWLDYPTRMGDGIMNKKAFFFIRVFHSISDIVRRAVHNCSATVRELVANFSS